MDHLESSPPAPKELSVCLLGPPRVEAGDAVLRIPRRQVRALLYRLAAQAEPVSRSRLAFLFWPDTPEVAARRHLSGLLTHLRRALGSPELVMSSSEAAGLDFERIFSDILEFKRLSQRESKAEVLTRAVDLYRGPFLAGFSLPGSPEFESWVLQQRRACERQYLDVLTTLIEWCTAEGEDDAAIRYTRRYLATDELAEDMHRRLIRLYAVTGNRGAALRQFERCAAILERELGVSPLPETRAAYESTLESRSPTEPRAARDLSWATLPGLDVPLVGREAACRHLEEAFGRAQAGRGQVVLVSGEPGIGKSRLMEAFAARLGNRAVVLAAAARSHERPLPYQPVAEAFRSSPEWTTLASVLEPVWLTEAARLLPELRDLNPRLPPPLPAEPDEARTRLLEALCRMMLGLAAGPRPLLLCLDDLHWADTATLDWLQCLARRMIDRPILVLGTHRTDERGRIDDVRHSLLRLGMLSELSIGGLEPRSVLQIVRHLTGTRPGIEAFSGRLHQATGGNPFFLLETLRVLLEDGQLEGDLTALERVPLPDTVREAVETRLGRLDSRARQVLEAGAILGVSFDFDVVRHTAGRGEIETADGLDQAVARHLLLEDPSGYHFRHALIRRTVEAGLGPVRRQLLHRRAARALEQVARGEAGSIARHFELGGEAERALEYYAQAAEEAEEIFAWREAEAHHGRVLALLNRLDPDRSKPKHLALRGEILVSRARIRHLQGCLEKRDADLAALSGLVASSGDDDLRLLTALHRVRYHNLGGRYAGAIATGKEGLALARRLGDTKAQSRLLAHIGFAHYFLGQPRAALVALESAIDVSGEQTDRDMRGRIFHILGYVHYHLGNYPQALDYHREAYACNRAPEHHNRLAWNLMDIGFLKLKLGRAAEARERLTESLALARKMAYRPAEAYALTLLGDWELYQGNYAAALDLFRESLGMQAEVGSKHGMVAAKDGAGFASYHLGDLDRAQAALRGALEHAREIGLQRHIALALVGLGLVGLSGGSLPGARDALTEALAVARESQSPENVALALAALARAERKAGNAGAALRRAREALRVAQTRPLPACRAWGHAEAGLALMARGEPRQALEHTSKAVEALPRSHEAWVGAEEVRHAHARVLQLLDRDAEARKQAQLARAAVEAKADRISDPHRRERYRQFATSRLG